MIHLSAIIYTLEIYGSGHKRKMRVRRWESQRFDLSKAFIYKRLKADIFDSLQIREFVKDSSFFGCYFKLFETFGLAITLVCYIAVPCRSFDRRSLE